jgi:predicted DNA-binding protein|tara:strand:+ start:418 stop:591 length:174 start_codon:yes stop_codon:yes gene_type:complete
MDTTKWKSVLVPIEVYEEIKNLSKLEGRTISGQLRLIHETFKKVHVKQPVADLYVQD